MEKSIVELEYDIKHIISEIFPLKYEIDDINIDESLLSNIITVLQYMIHASTSFDWLDSEKLLSNYKTINEYIEIKNQMKGKIEKSEDRF